MDGKTNRSQISNRIFSLVQQPPHFLSTRLGIHSSDHILSQWMVSDFSNLGYEVRRIKQKSKKICSPLLVKYFLATQIAQRVYVFCIAVECLSACIWHAMIIVCRTMMCADVKETNKFESGHGTQYWVLGTVPIVCWQCSCACLYRLESYEC